MACVFVLNSNTAQARGNALPVDYTAKHLCWTQTQLKSMRKFVPDNRVNRPCYRRAMRSVEYSEYRGLRFLKTCEDIVRQQRRGWSSTEQAPYPSCKSHTRDAKARRCNRTKDNPICPYHLVPRKLGIHTSYFRSASSDGVKPVARMESSRPATHVRLITGFLFTKALL